MITASNSETAFNDQQYASCYPEGIDFHCWSQARNRIVAAEIQRFADPSAPILEIGCGTGVVLRHLRQQGLQAWGADIGHVAIPQDLQGYLYSGCDALELPESFRHGIRTLLALDVLEHLEHPADFVAECRRAFPQATRMIVTVPARKELWSNYDEFYGHYQRYDLPSVDELSRQTNLPLLDAKYFFHSLYWPLRCKTLGRIDREVHRSVPKYRTLHNWLTRFLVWEEWLLPRRLVGSSIMFVWNLERAPATNIEKWSAKVA